MGTQMLQLVSKVLKQGFEAIMFKDSSEKMYAMSELGECKKRA